MKGPGVFLVLVGIALGAAVFVWGRSGYYSSQAPILILLAVSALVCIIVGRRLARSANNNSEGVTSWRPTSPPGLTAQPESPVAITEPSALSAQFPTHEALIVAPPRTEIPSFEAVPVSQVEFSPRIGLSVAEGFHDDTREVVRAGLWRLVLPDGSSHPLTGMTVVGRAPVPASLGSAVLAISDPEHSISRSHASFNSSDGALRVTDLGSKNGVRVVRPDGKEIELEPNGTAVLESGCEVELGSYVVAIYRR